MKRHWIALASAEHVKLGRGGGFMQVCHGKAAPLARLEAGDGIAYYSPAGTFRGKDRLQAFTAIGIVAPGTVRQTDIGGGFRPFRRDVAWLEGRAAPIAPLLERLGFTAGRRNWGQRLRFGLLEVGVDDFAVIAGAMGAALPP